MEQGSKVLRPLLKMHRFEVRQLIQFWRLPIYSDQSNQKTYFLRNKVRKQLMPVLRIYFNPRIDNVLLNFADIKTSEQQYFQNLLRSLITSQIGLQNPIFTPFLLFKSYYYTFLPNKVGASFHTFIDSRKEIPRRILTNEINTKKSGALYRKQKKSQQIRFCQNSVLKKTHRQIVPLSKSVHFFSLGYRTLPSPAFSFFHQRLCLSFFCFFEPQRGKEGCLNISQRGEADERKTQQWVLLLLHLDTAYPKEGRRRRCTTYFAPLGHERSRYTVFGERKEGSASFLPVVSLSTYGSHPLGESEATKVVALRNASLYPVSPFSGSEWEAKKTSMQTGCASSLPRRGTQTGYKSIQGKEGERGRHSPLSEKALTRSCTKTAYFEKKDKENSSISINFLHRNFIFHHLMCSVNDNIIQLLDSYPELFKKYILKQFFKKYSQIESVLISHTSSLLPSSAEFLFSCPLLDTACPQEGRRRSFPKACISSPSLAEHCSGCRLRRKKGQDALSSSSPLPLAEERNVSFGQQRLPSLAGTKEQCSGIASWPFTVGDEMHSLSFLLYPEGVQGRRKKEERAKEVVFAYPKGVKHTKEKLSSVKTQKANRQKKHPEDITGGINVLIKEICTLSTEQVTLNYFRKIRTLPKQKLHTIRNINEIFSFKVKRKIHTEKKVMEKLISSFIKKKFSTKEKQTLLNILTRLT